MSPRRRHGRPVHGIVLLDKPAGLSSNQALQRVKRLYDAQKAGHTGNLDPFATGMLPACLGEATKTAGFMLDADKRYRAVAELGTRTGTGDPEGATVETAPVPELDEDRIRAAMAGLTGEIRQVPPMHSALKHQGRPLYELARRGETVERKARQVTIHALELLDWTSPRLEFEVHCSKGTYVRVLAEDLARALGTVAHLVALRRLEVAPFDPQGMVTLAQLEQSQAAGTLDAHLLPPDAGLVGWPVLT
ncbi:MAG: tRNA pseudouridine(55) synthase TruB, partial [Xanthomonadales bacterium]|nr:tRNA pseudouridine(55) synthase TruB [Xanthomonadales bacterium]